MLRTRVIFFLVIGLACSWIANGRVASSCRATADGRKVPLWRCTPKKENTNWFASFRSYTSHFTTNLCARTVNTLWRTSWSQFTKTSKITWNSCWCRSESRRVQTMAKRSIASMDQPNARAIEFNLVFWMPSITSKMRPHVSLTVKCNKMQISPAKRYVPFDISDAEIRSNKSDLFRMNE